MDKLKRLLDNWLWLDSIDTTFEEIWESPQTYFGPNYKELFNYLFYWESLSDDQQNSL
jgi:hypothetical protein